MNSVVAYKFSQNLNGFALKPSKKITSQSHDLSENIEEYRQDHSQIKLLWKQQAAAIKPGHILQGQE